MSYIKPTDVHKYMGIQDNPSEDIQPVIDTWQTVLERWCRQWFEPRTITIKFDGNDSDTIFLGVPIISVSSLKINSGTAALDPSYYRVYNSRTYPDDRRNPKIRLLRSDQVGDIYTQPMTQGRMRFLKGYQNQEITGSFGFTESDGSTPLPIKHALTKLVVEKMNARPGASGGGGGSVVIAGTVIEEETDGHRIAFNEAPSKPSRPGLSGITTDKEIQDIVKLYRAPLGLATTSQWSYDK
jgi:hypothetical protein